MKRKSRWKGCLFGCLGVFLAVIVFFGLASYWLVKKGSYEPPKAMLVPETEFYLFSEIKKENEQVVDFLTTQIKNVNQQQLRTLGESFPFFSPNQFRDKKARKEVLKLLPMRVEVSGDLDDDMVVGVGFSIYNNMARIGFWLLTREVRKNGDGIFKEVGDKSYIKPDAEDDYFLALDKSVFYFSKTESGMQRVLSATDPEPVSLDRFPALGEVDRTAALWGFSRGKSLGRLWAYVHDDEGLEIHASETGLSIGQSELTCMGFHMVPEGTDTLRMQMFLDIAPVTSQTEAAVSGALDAWLAEAPMHVEKFISERPGGYAITLEFSDFSDLSGMNFDLD